MCLKPHLRDRHARRSMGSRTIGVVAVRHQWRLRNPSGPDNVTFMGWRVHNGRFLAALMLAPPALAQSIEFNRDIRPILSERCFSCHGPDAAHRQAGLRFDLQDGAKAVGDEILRRVASGDPLERMPPPSSGKAKLSAHEIDLLRGWVAQGAPWQPFWSFIPPQRPAPPAVKDEAWARNPIDRFILARLEREGLHPSAEADRRLLIRRVSLDLTGLPPTPGRGAGLPRRRVSRTLTKRWSTGCSPRRATASAWRSAGWKPRATAIATATRPTARATCGAGATG